MRCEHWTCKNIHVHSLRKENTDAQLGRHLPPLQWSLLSQTLHLTMFIPPAPSPQHHPPFLIYSFVNNAACDTRHNSHTGGLRSVFVRSRSCTGGSPDEPTCRDTQHNNLFFFSHWDSCVYDHGRPKSLTATKIQLTARLHLRGCKAAVLGRYHETHSHYTSQNTQYTSTDVPAWVTVPFFFWWLTHKILSTGCLQCN